MPRFILGRVDVEPGATVNVPLDEDLDVGFAYVLHGGGEGAVIGGHNQESGMHTAMSSTNKLSFVSNKRKS